MPSYRSFDEEGLDRASFIQGKISSGTAGKLAGMGIGLKSLLLGIHSNRMPFGVQLISGFVDKNEPLNFSKYIGHPNNPFRFF